MKVEHRFHIQYHAGVNKIETFSKCKVLSLLAFPVCRYYGNLSLVSSYSAYLEIDVRYMISLCGWSFTFSDTFAEWEACQQSTTMKGLFERLDGVI